MNTGAVWKPRMWEAGSEPMHPAGRPCSGLEHCGATSRTQRHLEAGPCLPSPCALRLEDGEVGLGGACLPAFSRFALRVCCMRGALARSTSRCPGGGARLPGEVVDSSDEPGAPL